MYLLRQRLSRGLGIQLCATCPIQSTAGVMYNVPVRRWPQTGQDTANGSKPIIVETGWCVKKAPCPHLFKVDMVAMGIKISAGAFFTHYWTEHLEPTLHRRGNGGGLFSRTNRYIRSRKLQSSHRKTLWRCSDNKQGLQCPSAPLFPPLHRRAHGRGGIQF